MGDEYDFLFKGQSVYDATDGPYSGTPLLRFLSIPRQILCHHH